ncbi:glucose-1-phosphate adenylyltransferase subunit GlgD [Pseudalkalibacillus hwajinpoensis]|uniref:Glucose-1-phosphate adenylyltransferase subunit GlgD n=1 Tax=Guptibacillus hwajinpoensis TaxID=208199 RepID=A0A4U1MLE9_9BACL|nr:glucose-1-phosphate adenylyltransferase subunit GlgD [Pseudalkalibacillus hwajinpoensis]TKD71534.1 glucose-1-phosphate adenylyltransferase subunit GlgD [Pseudalkalibacillus hwajinpoensis]
MKKVVGVINLVDEKNNLSELTNHRSFASVPFAGRYRLIDFSLSNMTNASINTVAVFTREKYRSLFDHLGSGREWDLDRHRGGLFFQPPADDERKSDGDISSFYENLSYFKRSLSDYVLVTNGQLVWNVDFDQVIQEHEAQNADITVVYKPCDDPYTSGRNYNVLYTNDDERVDRLNLDVEALPGDNVYLNTFLMNSSLLISLVEDSVKTGKYDSINEAIAGSLDRYHVHAYHFGGYVTFIDNIESYYRYSMEMLDPNVTQELFYNKGPIYTKVKHESPAKYLESSNVSNSLVANGCIISGTVENSILFRGIRVGKGAVIRNSIIMQKCEIGEGAIIENVILDKDVSVSPGETVRSEDQPRVIAKSTVI